jgi:predicted DCC family thiol-disulfide oxidoreductase YuxK
MYGYVSVKTELVFSRSLEALIKLLPDELKVETIRYAQNIRIIKKFMLNRLYNLVKKTVTEFNNKKEQPM